MSNSEDKEQDIKELPNELESCPRCGEELKEIIWGQTNCPSCGLHFECC